MNMKSSFLFVVCFGLTYLQGVSAENEHELKRGVFPYMAFIYYSDPSIVDATGERFVRSAVIIREEWLVTSAMGQNFINPANGFPRKTLLARAGAIAIDANFTLNEDEDEQEREVIRIVRPYNHSATQWWTTDISLMKTLFPFNITAAVGIKSLNIKPELEGKACSILVFAKRPKNKTEDKILMMLFVDLLPPSIDNCGSHFAANTMVCAVDSEDNKNIPHDDDFCHGNSGGPLICDREVKGLQTYIDHDCTAPHLYQLLSAWDTFITCGIEEKCNEEQCGNICDVTYKDPPPDSLTPQPIENNAVELASVPAHTLEVTSAPILTVSSSDTPSRLDSFRTEHLTKMTTPSTTQTTTTEAIATTEETTQKPWPKEASTAPRSTSESQNEAEDDESEREANVEAQQKKSRSASDRNMCVLNTLFFGFLVLVCL